MCSATATSRVGRSHALCFSLGETRLNLTRWTALLGIHLIALAGCGGYRVYWGDVHGHTDFSDGNVTIDEYLTYARDVARLDFVIVTDHDFGNGPPWRLSRDAWRSIQEAVDRFTVDGRFVAIAGYEWTSQPKYWSGYTGPEGSEALFDGPPFWFNHKNVYFAAPVEDIFRAKDAAYRTPDQLAQAVAAVGGLIHNNHPTAGPDGRDQWAYGPEHFAVITNTEIGPDRLYAGGVLYAPDTERTVQAFLNAGGRTGFVGASDTHVGRPAARTAVFARRLSREPIFEALRQRHNYSVRGARIQLRFCIDGHEMGEEVSVTAAPRLDVQVRGTAPLQEVAIIRNGAVIRADAPYAATYRLVLVDDSFADQAYYYVRVLQADSDEDGNPSCAWSSPMWVGRDGHTFSSRSRRVNHRFHKGEGRDKPQGEFRRIPVEFAAWMRRYGGSKTWDRGPSPAAPGRSAQRPPLASRA